MVTEVLRCQAILPGDSATGFKDLPTDEILSYGEVLRRVYGGERHLVFQTCIYSAGDPGWGWLFVIAVPVAVEGSTLPPGAHN